MSSNRIILRKRMRCRLLTCCRPRVCLRFPLARMRLFLFIASLLSATEQLWAGQICCPGLRCYDDGPPFDGLPLPKCPADLSVNMQVYTRRNPNNGESITRDVIPPSFNGKLFTMFIVHGWRETENFTWMHQTKDAVLAVADYNVILVGWKLGAGSLFYLPAASNTRTVGGEIALVSNNTISNGGSSGALMYCVGHSLGAHVCGHAGQQGQFRRITGLDPAGPYFLDRDWSVGLNPSCAGLVDVIHTDGHFFGMMKPVGHIDFYPNKGSHQPGCTTESVEKLLSDLKNFTILNSDADPSSLLEVIGCSHIRSHEFFTESIGTPCFLSRQKCYSEDLLPLTCTQSEDAEQSMGFHATSNPGIFYLETNPHQPFCLG